MKIRDDIRSIEQGMGSETAAAADLWGVAYLQVAEAHPSDRKIQVVAGAGRCWAGPPQSFPGPPEWFCGLWRLHAVRGWN